MTSEELVLDDPKFFAVIESEKMETFRFCFTKVRKIEFSEAELFRMYFVFCYI